MDTALIRLAVTVLILGLLFWALESLPLADPYRTVLRVLGIIILVVLLLRFVGLGF